MSHRVPSSLCSKPSMLLRVKSGDHEMASQMLHGLLSTYPKPNLYSLPPPPASLPAYSLLQPKWPASHFQTDLCTCCFLSGRLFPHGVPWLVFSSPSNLCSNAFSMGPLLTTPSHATTPYPLYCFPLHLSSSCKFYILHTYFVSHLHTSMKCKVDESRDLIVLFIIISLVPRKEIIVGTQQMLLNE